MKSRFRTLVSIIVVGGILLAGSITYASTTDTSASGQGKGMPPGKGRPGPGEMQSMKPKDGQGGFQTLAESLVKEGIITQETADKMVSYLKEKGDARKSEMDAEKETRPEKPDFLKGLVDAGILTQEQADAIKQYTDAQEKLRREEQKNNQQEQQLKRQEQMKNQLDNLVNSGTITQEQEDKIIAYLEKQQENRRAEMDAEKDSVKSMTDDERKAYFESKKGTRPEKSAPLKELVDNGTLTQEQADAAAKALRPERPQS